MDGLGYNLENSPDSSSPHSEMFDAYTGNLNRFKRLALNHAKGEEIGVREEIRKAKDRDGRGTLHIAAAGGSLQVCRYLLETLKLDVDPKDGRGITPLYHAIFEGHLDTVRYLLENGANADASSDANYTPLRCAAESGDIKIITLLLSRGARVDVASRSGTALQEAAFNGHRDAVKVLLDHGANPNVAIGLYTYIPLFSAISAKSWECVELLLQAGADPNAVSYGYTPLALPAKYGHVDVIRRLLKAGADPNYKMNFKKSKFIQAAMDGLGENPEVMCEDLNDPYFEMFKAAYTGKLVLFYDLALDHAKGKGIEVKEEIRKAKDKYGRGSLHIAAEGGSLVICKYLIETLKLDVDPKDAKGITPLYHAIWEGHLETVTYLLEKGADADASDDENRTPLRTAAATGDTKIITLLLSWGARVDVETREGTALGQAASNGHRDAVKVLLDHGANPNPSGQCQNNRPLVTAIIRKSWECVDLLLKAGADPNDALCEFTPLVVAAMDGRADVITRLLEAGADPNYKINMGLTALETAAGFRNYQAMGVLFPVTFRIPAYPDWSIAGLVRHVNSTYKMLREVHKKEKYHQAKSKGKDAFQGGHYLSAALLFEEAMDIFPKYFLLSNLSACYARLGDGISALDYATKCICERPEWPKAYYRKGVALNILKRYGDAADAFNKGLTLDPENKELKEACMKAIEAGLSSVKVEEDNAD